MAELIAKGNTFAPFPYRHGRAFVWSCQAVFIGAIKAQSRRGRDTLLRRLDLLSKEHTRRCFQALTSPFLARCASRKNSHGDSVVFDDRNPVPVPFRKNRELETDFPGRGSGAFAPVVQPRSFPQLPLRWLSLDLVPARLHLGNPFQEPQDFWRNSAGACVGIALSHLLREKQN